MMLSWCGDSFMCVSKGYLEHIISTSKNNLSILCMLAVCIELKSIGIFMQKVTQYLFMDR